MILEEISSTLTELFGAETLQVIAPGSWQVETSSFRLLVLLSDDYAWMRVLLPIVPIEQAQPFLAQFLAANFDETQEVRYALYQEVIWAVFHHNATTLTSSDFSSAIARILSLHQAGLDDVFNQLVESRILQIIQVAKQQGQSMASTMQSLERFYAEGLLGELQQTSEEREQVLAAWKRRLESLWEET